METTTSVASSFKILKSESHVSPTNRFTVNEGSNSQGWLCTINKYGSYLLIRDWAGLKWHPVLKEWEQLQDKPSEDVQNSYR